MTDKSEAHPTLNILSLIRLKPECKIMPTRVDFSSPNKLASTQISITPAFNNDRCFYTPAFTIPADFKHYHKNLQIEKCQFEEKMQRSLQETADLTQMSTEQTMVAVAPNSNYCQICQERFEHYFVHIILKSHMIRMAGSDASEKIKDLCGQFQETRVGAAVKGKIKLIKKQQKKEEKIVRGKRSSASISQLASTTEGFTTTNYHSTALIEDLQV